MTWKSYFIFLGMACLFVPTYNAMTMLDYQRWRCDDLCTKEELKQHLRAICLQVSAYTQDIPDHYDDRTVKLMSKCEDNTSVEFDIENNEKFPFLRKVGRCYLSHAISKCVTKGSEKNSVFVYSYVNKVCRDPVEISYDFSSAPPIEGTFLKAEQFGRWRCTSICREEWLRKHVPSICLQITSDIPNHSDDRRIVSTSGCRDGIPVELETEQGWIFHAGSREYVGMCYLSTTVTKCITRGQKDDSILVYSFENGVCIEPRQLDYNFNKTPFAETEEFQKSLDRQKSKTNEGAKEPSSLSASTKSPSFKGKPDVTSVSANQDTSTSVPIERTGITPQPRTTSPSSSPQPSASSSVKGGGAVARSGSSLLSKSPSSKKKCALLSCWSCCLEWIKNLFVKSS